MALEDTVRDMAKKRGMSMAQLARKMGILPQNILVSLRGGCRTSFIEALAKALDIEPYELFITKEELAEIARQRRAARLGFATNVLCPCCGKQVCVRLSTE